jgi:hypothetical protein
MMAKISKDSMDLCKRVDASLERASKDPDAFYDFAVDNEEVVKQAFLARAVVRGLITPLTELIDAIAEIEDEFTEFANEVEVDDEEDE